MRDDLIEGRLELLEEMRETVRQNEQNMRSCANIYDQHSDSWDKEDEFPELSIKESTFSLRLLVSIVILGGFLWMHMEDTRFFGYQSQKVVEAISQDADLQTFTNSVKINP